MESPEQSREDCDSGAVQVLKSKRCRDTKPSCPYNCTEFGHVVREGSNEGTSLVDKPEHFRVPGHKIQANEHDSDICLGHQTTEPSTIAGNSPTQAVPEASSVDDSKDSLELPLIKNSRAILVSTESTYERPNHEEPKSLRDKNTMKVESIADVRASSQVRKSIPESSSRGPPTEP